MNAAPRVHHRRAESAHFDADEMLDVLLVAWRIERVERRLVEPIGIIAHMSWKRQTVVTLLEGDDARRYLRGLCKAFRIAKDEARVLQARIAAPPDPEGCSAAMWVVMYDGHQLQTSRARIVEGLAFAPGGCA